MDPPFADLTNVLLGPHAPQAPAVILHAQGVTFEQAREYDSFKNAALRFHGMPVREFFTCARQPALLHDIAARVLRKAVS